MHFSIVARSRSRSRIASVAAATTVALLVGSVSPVAADHDLYRHVSAGGFRANGTVSGNGNFVAGFLASSTDGKRVIFNTAESLAIGDTDASTDIYQRFNGATTRISVGAINGNGATSANFFHASADATRVTFGTGEKLVAADTDSAFDLYQRSGSTTTLISAGQINGNGNNSAQFAGATPDGTHIFFHTDEKLVAADTDNLIDLYERFNGTTTLVSAGAINGNGAFAAGFSAANAAGSRVWFSTLERLDNTDTDSVSDIYERSGGQTFRVSRGAINGNGAFEVLFESATDNGKVFFESQEKLASTDTDTDTDLYSFDGTTVEHVSRGLINGNGAFASIFQASNVGGSVVIFSTPEKLVAGDTDTAEDVYQRFNGQTALLSLGSQNLGAAFVAASSDATHVFFVSAEKLVAGDTDGSVDLYERNGATLRQVSVGGLNGNGAFNASFAGISTDGLRAFFSTNEKLVQADTDAQQDIYERISGTTTDVISLGNNAVGAFFFGATPSGSAVFFTSAEKILIDDTDSTVDVYGAYVP